MNIFCILHSPYQMSCGPTVSRNSRTCSTLGIRQTEQHFIFQSKCEYLLYLFNCIAGKTLRNPFCRRMWSDVPVIGMEGETRSDESRLWERSALGHSWQSPVILAGLPFSPLPWGYPGFYSRCCLGQCCVQVSSWCWDLSEHGDYKHRYWCLINNTLVSSTGDVHSKHLWRFGVFNL